MNFVLIDYQPPGSQINRDQTGTYGSFFKSEGCLGTLLSSLKAGGIKLPVLSFSYAASILRAHGHKVNIVNQLPAEGGDVAVFATVLYHWKEDHVFLEEYKKRFPKTRLGVLGAVNQALPELFRDVCDFNIGGDVESALFAFLEGRWNWQGYFDGTQPLDLSRVPLPDWDGFPIANYSYRPALARKNFLTIQTSRGCAFGCDFCPYMVTQGRQMRFRPLEAVEAEVRLLTKKYGVRSVFFRDILFTANRQRTVELCDRLIHMGTPIEWACETNLEGLDAELIDKMHKAGMRVINLGIESGDPEVLRRFGKRGSDSSQLCETIQNLHKRNIRVQAFYILGLWDDTPESMRKTIALSHKINTFSAQYCVATPFPGTRFFEKKKEFLLHRDWSKYTEYEPVLRLPFASAAEVIHCRNRAYNSYYIRPQWWMRYGYTVIKQFI